jgi:hypothetical protein
MNEFHEETLMLLGLAAFAAFIAWLFFRRAQLAAQRSQLDLELRNRLLDKFANAQEFLEFVETEKGRKLLQGLAPQASNPRLTSMRFMQAGALSVLLGYGFYLNAGRLKGLTDINFVNKAQDLKSWGTLLVAAGVGQVVAAAIGYEFARRHGRETRSDDRNG